jgi:hypothetical protein
MVSLLGELCEVGLLTPDVAVVYLEGTLENHDSFALGANTVRVCGGKAN